MSLPRVPRSRPRPKLCAIPKRKTEAAVYAEIQQLAVEKQRLQQELIAIRERRAQIETRLQEIEHAVTNLQDTAHRYATAAQSSASDQADTSVPLPSRFQPLTLDY